MANSSQPARQTSSTLKSNRIEALDFTKGALVLFMVLYHWLNYFLGPGGTMYRYLRFLPPSFIFITGFLISNAYLARYSKYDPRIPKRLLARGFKILGIFVALNFLIMLLVTGLHALSPANYFAVFVTGNVLIVGVGKAAAFYILVPISYLLFLAAILSIPYRFFQYTYHCVFAAFAIGVSVLGICGERSNNLELVAVGLLGLLLGFSSVERINALAKYAYLFVIAYVGYVITITYWEPNFLFHTAGVCLTVLVLFLLGTTPLLGSYAGRQIVLLGKYPLFGYIAQIAILQVLRRSLAHFYLGTGELILTFVGAVGLTLLTVVFMDFIRKRFRLIDSAYKAVFA